eukprot:scaffold8008_cov430-Prasinococcus_capsulatus_cf.AAC.13
MKAAAQGWSGQQEHPPLEQEYAWRFAELDRKLHAQKEIESTIANSVFVETRSLPSFFDYYPRCRYAAEERKAKGDLEGAVKLLRCCRKVLETGEMSALDAEMGDQSLDLTTDDASNAKSAGSACASLSACRCIAVAPPGADAFQARTSDLSFLWIGRWQFDGGPDGWLSFMDEAQAAVERAYNERKSSVQLSIFGTTYCIDLLRNVQTNLSTNSVRRIRRVSLQ